MLTNYVASFEQSTSHPLLLIGNTAGQSSLLLLSDYFALIWAYIVSKTLLHLFGSKALSSLYPRILTQIIARIKCQKASKTPLFSRKTRPA